MEVLNDEEEERGSVVKHEKRSICAAPGRAKEIKHGRDLLLDSVACSRSVACGRYSRDSIGGVGGASLRLVAPGAGAVDCSPKLVARLIQHCRERFLLQRVCLGRAGPWRLGD